MQRSKEEVLAAAEYFEWDGFDASKEALARQLAVTILRETAAGMDGFEAFVESGAGDVSISWAGGEDDAENTLTDALKKYYLAGRASLQPDVDAKQKIIENACRDWAEDHTAIENMLKERGIDTTGDDFVDIVEFVERLCAGFGALADEVERQGSILRDSYSLVSLAWHRYGLRNRIHELKDENIYDWEKMLADLDSKSPARVRDILAARRKEGK